MVLYPRCNLCSSLSVVGVRCNAVAPFALHCSPLSSQSASTQHLILFHLLTASWQRILFYRKYKHFLKSQLSDFLYNCFQFHCLFCKLPAKFVCVSYGTSLNSATAIQTELYIFIPPPPRPSLDQTLNHLDNFCETIRALPTTV